MKVKIVKNPEEGGKVVFGALKEAIRNGAKVLGLATGSTPITFYNEVKKSDLDFSNMFSINLDEYVGLGADHPQSYAYFMEEQLFNEKFFKQSYLPNGLADNLEEEVARYDEIISSHPIDFQILGIGRNGHIGFNEPGTPFTSTTHLVDLTPSTIEANARFFEQEEDVPKQAISMGIASILSAKTIVLMAYGEEKADAIKALVEGPVTEMMPASSLQNHPDVLIVCDEAAAKELER